MSTGLGQLVQMKERRRMEVVSQWRLTVQREWWYVERRGASDD